MGLGVGAAYNIPRRSTDERCPSPRLGDRPLENSPLLEFVCSMWSSAWMGCIQAHSPRVHLKYLNGLILSIEPRSTGTRDETTLTLPRWEEEEVWRISDAAETRNEKYHRREAAINVKFLKSLSSVA